MADASEGERPQGGLLVDGLRKRYAGTYVVDGVDLHVARGTVHALLGPNGAGKSTIIKCLNGAVHPDVGTIALDGHRLRDLTPTLARQAGIATIHQNRSVVDSLSISDNVFLGRELAAGIWLRRRAQRHQTAALIQQFGLDVDPDTKVGRLSSGHKQLVEIAKAWNYGEIKLLILDEPTAALSQDESEVLFREIDRIRRRGIGVIYVTHRLGEVFRVADQVTVIRNGVKTLSTAIGDLTPQKLIAAFSDFNANPEPRDRVRTRDAYVTQLEVKSYEGRRFGPLTFSARSGEIVGLYGSIGAGRTSFLETLAGRYQPSGGRALLDSRRLNARSVGAALRQGVAIVPEDRNRQGLWPILSSSTNLLVPQYSSFARFGVRSRSAERKSFNATATELSVTPDDPDIAVSNLSGGNAQKILIGRWLASVGRLKLLLLDEPTSGVDIESRRQIHSAVRSAAAAGLTVLVCSSDAEELVQLADRVLVFDNGQIVTELAGAEVGESTLLAAAHQFHTTATQPGTMST